MGSEFDKLMDDMYVDLEHAPDFRFDAGRVEVILRNSDRPSEWKTDKLPNYTSTRTGLVDNTKQFTEPNKDYFIR